MVETSSYEERMEELKIEYNEFLETKRGQEWKEHWKNEIGSDSCGDFGDYLYDDSENVDVTWNERDISELYKQA